MSEKFTGAQKAAVVLMQIGRDRAARVLSTMEDAEVEEITAEIMRLEHVEQDTADRILEEFHTASISGPGVATGGVGYAQSLLEASMGSDKAALMLERIATARVGAPFEFLQNADAKQVLSLLSGEQAQTIALVLAHLRPDHASQIIAGLTPTQQTDVAHRIALMDRALPDVVAHVADNLARRASAVFTPHESSAIGGVQPLVEIINRADPGTEKVILEGLQGRDEALAEEVRSRMFVFGDIVLLEDRAVQLVLRNVETSSLAVALKGISEQVQDKIMNNLSERARETLIEDVDLLGPTRMSEVEEARALIVQSIRRLEEQGEIVIRRDGEDEYV